MLQTCCSAIELPILKKKMVTWTGWNYYYTTSTIMSSKKGTASPSYVGNLLLCVQWLFHNRRNSGASLCKKFGYQLIKSRGLCMGQLHPLPFLHVALFSYSFAASVLLAPSSPDSNLKYSILFQIYSLHFLHPNCICIIMTRSSKLQIPLLFQLIF